MKRLQALLLIIVYYLLVALLAYWLFKVALP